MKTIQSIDDLAVPKLRITREQIDLFISDSIVYLAVGLTFLTISFSQQPLPQEIHAATPCYQEDLASYHSPR